MQPRVKVAYWQNTLGENCSSEIHAEFDRDGVEYIVVWDWREAMRGHGLEVMPRTELDVIRWESRR